MNSLIERLKQHWNPQPIQPPEVDPDLPKLTGLQRATESIRYSILSLEWWLSPNGKLREWLRLNGKIGSILLIPAVLVVPLVSLILWQIHKWAGWMVGILILFPLAALLAVIITLSVVTLLRIIISK
jgi:hypothetical protein